MAVKMDRLRKGRFEKLVTAALYLKGWQGRWAG
jgi:hypothetical protein